MTIIFLWEQKIRKYPFLCKQHLYMYICVYVSCLIQFSLLLYWLTVLLHYGRVTFLDSQLSCSCEETKWSAPGIFGSNHDWNSLIPLPLDCDSNQIFIYFSFNSWTRFHPIPINPNLISWYFSLKWLFVLLVFH